MQYNHIKKNPYKYSSDDIIFMIYAKRNNLKEKNKELFFSKGQPCLRSSPLVKRYGWGIHFNSNGKIALVEQNSIEYSHLLISFIEFNVFSNFCPW